MMRRVGIYLVDYSFALKLWMRSLVAKGDESAYLGGKRYARYMLDPALRAFRSTEKTVALLAANAEVNGRIVSVYGDDDTHIPEGCELPGATNLAFPVSGHFRVLADARVLAAVDAAIGR